ncbi:MAG: response regulator [Proteobacteria bacterium]|nr:response regulator [Pseudomonadota bacterium]
MEKKQRGVKILLVDDEEIFLEATARQLGVRGFKVTTADSGEAALLLMHDTPPDVVVLDQQMPGMSGSETFVEMKRINPLVEVIILTGNTSVDNALELLKMGTFDYLMKPINIDDLLYKIEDAYTRKMLNEKQQ